MLESDRTGKEPRRMSEKGQKRKRNKKFYCGQNAKKKKIEDLSPGIKGFLISFNNERREALVVSEAYALLNEYADALYGPEKIDEETPLSEPEDAEEQSIEDALKKEITDIKNRKFKERRFKAVRSKVKNLIFVKTTLEEPNELTEAIFTDLEKTKLVKTRKCIKCIPVMVTCYASEKAIKAQTEELFKSFFEQGRTEATYSIVFKARCNSTLKRDDVIQEMGKIIEDLNEEWKVNYNEPDYTIAVNVLTNVCAIGILKNFKRFRNYNLQSFGTENKVTAGDALEQKELTIDKKTAEEKDGLLNQENAVPIKDKEITST